MIRVDPSNWTADFRIARALTEAYKSSGFDEALFFCVGDPEDPILRLGTLIADETIKYYQGVMGTSERPVTPDTLPERVEEAIREWPGRFIVAIEPGKGLESHLGSVEITDRGLSIAPPSARHVADFSDVTVNVVLSIDDVSDVKARRLAAAEKVEKSESGLRQAALEVGTDDESGMAQREKFKPLRPDQITPNVVRKLADTVIDGNLRFLSKIGKQRL